MKDSRWKQLTPVDQLVAIRASLEGHFDNWQHHIIGDRTFSDCFEDHMAQIAALEPFLRGTEKWQ